jgi:serine/threonine protein kinase
VISTWKEDSACTSISFCASRFPSILLLKAPEILLTRKATIASDVWSFGCLLYEAWSTGCVGRFPIPIFFSCRLVHRSPPFSVALCQMPYADLSDDQVISLLASAGVQAAEGGSAVTQAAFVGPGRCVALIAVCSVSPLAWALKLIRPLFILHSMPWGVVELRFRCLALDAQQRPSFASLVLETQPQVRRHRVTHGRADLLFATIQMSTHSLFFSAGRNCWIAAETEAGGSVLFKSTAHLRLTTTTARHAFDRRTAPPVPRRERICNDSTISAYRIRTKKCDSETLREIG